MVACKVTDDRLRLAPTVQLRKPHQKIERLNLFTKSSSLVVLNRCFLYACKFSDSSQNTIQQTEIGDDYIIFSRGSSESCQAALLVFYIENL